MTAPTTYSTKQAALNHIAEVRADRLRGVYRDHRDGAQQFDAYAVEWIDNGGSRGRLAPRTTALYRDLVARDLTHFAPLALSAITPAEVRRWYAATRRATATRAAKRGGTGEARVRQAYALLRSIMATAARDRLIGENPCSIVGAGIASAPERPYLSPDVLAQIVGAMPTQYALPIRVMFGAHLRLGELVALQRGDFNPESGALLVERQSVDVGDRTEITGTKTGQVRTVALPPSIAVLLADHLATTQGFAMSAMFTGKGMTPITRGGVQQAWRAATKRLGIAQFHVHDVRHAGLTVAAQSGATTRELMARAGHRTAAAAMTYQHVAEERNALLPGAMDALSAGALGVANGTPVARGAVHAIASGDAGEVESLA